MKSDFRDLKVWKKGFDLRRYIFELVKGFPTEEKTRLADQMIRSSRSITNNISEGYGRYNYQDNIRFCILSRGSIYELIDHVEISLECNYIEKKHCNFLMYSLEELLALTNGYIKYLRGKKLSLKTAAQQPNGSAAQRLSGSAAQRLNHSTSQPLNNPKP